MEDHERDHPERYLPAAAGGSRREDEQGPDRGRRREAHERPKYLGIAPAGDRVEHEVEQAHHEEATPNNMAFAQNAPGTARATTSIAAIAPNMPARTWPASGSSVFVSQA